MSSPLAGDSSEKTNVHTLLERLCLSGLNYDKYKDKAKKKGSSGSKRKRSKSRHGKKKHSSREHKKSKKSSKHKSAPSPPDEKKSKANVSPSATSKTVKTSEGEPQRAAEREKQLGGASDQKMQQCKQLHMTRQDSVEHAHCHRHHKPEHRGSSPSIVMRPSPSVSPSTTAGQPRPTSVRHMP